MNTKDELRDLSGKWIMKERSGQGKEFLLIIGRSTIESELAHMCTETQYVRHYIVNGIHVINKTADLIAGSVARVIYSTCVVMDGKTHNHEPDTKGLGKSTCVSKIKDKNTIIDVWRFRNVIMKGTRVLNDKGNKTTITTWVKDNITQEEATCIQVYEKEKVWSTEEIQMYIDNDARKEFAY